MAIITPKQALSKIYRQMPIDAADFDRFVQALLSLFDRVEDGQKEEKQKEYLRSFLSSSFYKPYHMAPEGDIDLAIRLDKSSKSKIGVLIEVKSTTAKGEMISRDDLNRKALQELLLYYLRERITHKNHDIKHLVVSNVYEFFIFDAHEFERKFYSNNSLRRDYLDFVEGRKTSSKTDFFYKEIASAYIEEVAQELEYTYFDLRDYRKLLGKKGATPSAGLVELYKVLSDVHLLKLSHQNDSNSLNQAFYTELLHIIGLEEKREGGKSIIVRKPQGRRDEASLLENTIEQLDTKDSLKVVNKTLYGNDKEEQLFNVAMELCITWINRILFLKLLEAQLLRYHKGDKKYRFMSHEKIENYDQLNTLFLNVLAKPLEQRKAFHREAYDHIPYLNSSLFEVTDLENKTCLISNLPEEQMLPVLKKSVLKGKKGKNHTAEALPPLEYLLRFLDAYNFSSDVGQEVQEEAKTLINASVLGLIFEKINGHRDGAIFTPGFITMFMCREVITKAVLQRFNDHYGWKCESRVELYNKIGDIDEANRLINSIRLCDPAVGSGHFLVSALNELIYTKYELGVLIDASGKRIRQGDYQITIENDELVVTDEEGNLFSYNPLHKESQRVQETLFREKRHIIENCLFGVDINPNSVKICRLRLWIELLKNAYYTEESGYARLETLPNIDINIKCGNSLLHRFELTDSIQSILKSAKIDIGQYREAVTRYKNAQSKEEKKDLEDLIFSIKSTLKKEISKNDRLYIKLNNCRAELAKLENSGLFSLSKGEEKRRKELRREVSTLEAMFEEIRSNKIYLEAFEWRIEFPELLDADGSFLGFDCIIGNPPYIQLQSMGDRADALSKMHYKSYVRMGDIYCLFYELGVSLLKSNGYLCYITSNKWMRAGYGEALRGFLAGETNPLMLIDFSGVKVFDSATVDNNILLLQKSENTHSTLAGTISDVSVLNEKSLFSQPLLSRCSFSSSESWVILSPIEQSIKQKIEAVGTPLKDWDINIYRGILTGCNEAFIISTEKRDEILNNCKSEGEKLRTQELIRPILRGRDIKRYGYDWANLWLIATHNGIKGVKPRIDINEYPAVKAHLDQYWDKIEKRADQGDTPYNLRNCVYMDDFSQPKIMWGEISDRSKFSFDFFGRYLPEATAFYLKGECVEYLFSALNSFVSEWFFSTMGTTTGVGTIRWKKYTIEQLLVAKPTKEQQVKLLRIFDDFRNNLVSISEFERFSNTLMYEIYQLSQEEIRFIEGRK